jgi:hypothetical protein
MMKIRLGSVIGGAVLAVASLLLFWVANTGGVPDRLGRYGISARSAESSGFPGSEVVGRSRRLRGESYGAGGSDLSKGWLFARRGQELVLDYDLSITQGTVRVSLNRVPALRDELWGITVQGDRQGTIRVPIQRTGLHQLSVTQFRYAGTFDLAWRLE